MNDYKFYPKHQHPVHYEFLKADMSIKDQVKLKDYFEQTLNISIRVIRKKIDCETLSVFMSSKQSNEKCIQYVFDQIEDISEKFHIRSFHIDLSSIQKVV